MRRARTWGWARMRRYDDPYNDLGPSSPHPGHMASSSNYAAMPYLGHAPMRRDCLWPNPSILLSRFLTLPRSSSSVPQAASSLFTAVADGPQTASIGVPASLSLLKKFWSGTRISRLRFQEGA